VIIEEVIRFLTTEVGVRPKAENWDELLIESEKLFRRLLKKHCQSTADG
jgi:hypothetical protein